ASSSFLFFFYAPPKLIIEKKIEREGPYVTYNACSALGMTTGVCQYLFLLIIDLFGDDGGGGGQLIAST
ncbi:hypothetical protein ACJX0J_032408, partial [Zea mays]